MKFIARYNELCAILLVFLCLWVLFYVHIAIDAPGEVDYSRSSFLVDVTKNFLNPSSRIIIEPIGLPHFNSILNHNKFKEEGTTKSLNNAQRPQPGEPSATSYTSYV